MFGIGVSLGDAQFYFGMRIIRWVQKGFLYFVIALCNDHIIGFMNYWGKNESNEIHEQVIVYGLFDDTVYI